MLNSVSVQREITRSKKRRKRQLGGLGLLVATAVLLALLWSGVPKEPSGAAVAIAGPGTPLNIVRENAQVLQAEAWRRTLHAARGPVRVGLQVGHEDVAAHPNELAQLRWNTGGHANGVDEVDLNRSVAEALRVQLEAQGVAVDLLRATPPPGYYADLMLSLHTDSVTDPERRGYKSATFAPVRNPLEPQLKETIDRAYYAVSGLPNDHHNTTENMYRYYAFNGRYRHSVHPGTPALIVELGYLSSAEDMAFLSVPKRPAAALSRGVIQFLQERGRLPAERATAED